MFCSFFLYSLEVLVFSSCFIASNDVEFLKVIYWNGEILWINNENKLLVQFISDKQKVNKFLGYVKFLVLKNIWKFCSVPDYLMNVKRAREQKRKRNNYCANTDIRTEKSNLLWNCAKTKQFNLGASIINFYFLLWIIHQKLHERHVNLPKPLLITHECFNQATSSCYCFCYSRFVFVTLLMQLYSHFAQMFPAQSQSIDNGMK